MDKAVLETFSCNNAMWLSEVLQKIGKWLTSAVKEEKVTHSNS